MSPSPQFLEEENGGGIHGLFIDEGPIPLDARNSFGTFARGVFSPACAFPMLGQWPVFHESWAVCRKTAFRIQAKRAHSGDAMEATETECSTEMPCRSVRIGADEKPKII